MSLDDLKQSVQAASYEQKDPDYLSKEMEKGVFEDIDETFPQYIRDNEKHFRKIGFIH